MATSTTSNTGVATAIIDAFNAHDVGRMKDLWAPDGWERFPDQTCQGSDAIGAYFQGLFAAVPDVRMDVQATAGENDTVFLRWKMTGTHTGGTFQGIAVTGKAIELDGIDQFTIRDGKVQSNFVVFDQMAVARAFGLLPPDGSAADRAVKRGFNALLALKKRAGR